LNVLAASVAASTAFRDCRHLAMQDVTLKFHTPTRNFSLAQACVNDVKIT